MKPRSLTTRALLVALAAQMLCAAVLCSAALLHEFHTRMRALDTQIQGSCDSLLGAVQDAEDPEANITIDPAELKLPAADVFAVYNQDGRVIGRSPDAPPGLISRSSSGFREARLPRERYRIYQRDGLRVIDRAETKGIGLRRPVTLVYASPERHMRHEVFEAARFYILVSLLVTGMMAVILPWLIRRTVRPLAELASATGEIQAPDFPFHPPDSALEVTELRPLTEVLSRSITRVRASFAREHRFVSDAAHELKTSTAVIRSSVQLLLLKRRSESEYKGGLERLVNDVDRLEALIAQMLQLGRAEELTGESVPLIDLGAVAMQVSDLLKPVAEHRDLDIQVQAEPGSHIRLRREQAESLLSNLVLNALQHSAPCSPPVTVVVRRLSASQVGLTVSDRGAGIAPESLPHIFERFYREDISRSRQTGGTGLGLAIAKSIVENAQGTIHVKSQKDHGTTMHVTFRSA